MDNDKELFQKELYAAIKRGAQASEFSTFIMPVLDNRKAALVDNLETLDVYYQKIDNRAILAIQLELRILAEMRANINAAIKDGAEAESKLRELNQPELKRESTRLRF